MGKQDLDHTLNLVLVGDPGTGKRKLLTMYLRGERDEQSILEDAAAFRPVIKTVRIKETFVVQLFVLPSNPEDPIYKRLFEQADGFMVVFAVNDRSSFNSVPRYHQDILTAKKFESPILSKRRPLNASSSNLSTSASNNSLLSTSPVSNDNSSVSPRNYGSDAQLRPSTSPPSGSKSLTQRISELGGFHSRAKSVEQNQLNAMYKKFPTVIIGTKTDLEGRVVTTNEAMSLADSLQNVTFFEVNQNIGRSINECFLELVRKIVQYRKEGLIEEKAQKAERIVRKKLVEKHNKFLSSKSASQDEDAIYMEYAHRRCIVQQFGTTTMFSEAQQEEES